MKVGPATPEQLDQFVRWQLAARLRSQSGELERAQRNGDLWLVSDSDGPMGGGLALPRPSSLLEGLWRDRPCAGRCLYVQKMVLAPDRRAGELGRDMLAAMLAEMEERARGAGFEHVRVDCVADNERLSRWYEHQGYYPLGARAVSGTQVLRLEKDLVAARELDRMFEDWTPDLTGTLLFVVHGDQVLLIDKKTGHGAGKINAPGGKLEADETPQACAIRETLEEVGVKVERPRLAAELKFADTVASQWLGYVFVAHEHSGNATESAEADPHWYALDAIPYERMWQDDRIWLPLVLAGHQVAGEFLFNDGTLRAHRLLLTGG